MPTTERWPLGVALTAMLSSTAAPTVTATMVLTLPTEIVIEVLPAPTPVTTPPVLTLATVPSPEVKVALEVTVPMLLSE